MILERRRVGREGEDFLQTLMDSRYKSGGPLSEHEITGRLVAALFAGHHTSSVTTAWSIIELVKHPAYSGACAKSSSPPSPAGRRWASPRSATSRSPSARCSRCSASTRPCSCWCAWPWSVDQGFFIPRGTWVLISPTVCAPDPRALPRSRRLRSRPLRAPARGGQARLRLRALRRRPPQVHGQRLRAAANQGHPGHPGAPLTISSWSIPTWSRISRGSWWDRRSLVGCATGAAREAPRCRSPPP